MLRSRREVRPVTWAAIALVAIVLSIPGASVALAQDTTPHVEVYGFVQADYVQDFKRVDPAWNDTLRPSKIPTTDGQFGEDGQASLSAKQSRLGVLMNFPTSNHPVYTKFEFDMFGVGVDAGKTTIRLRHAWGQWKKIGGGQTNGQFTDTEIFPNSLDYWGPNGMAFFRNVQVFYEPFNDGSSNARIAIEAPGASGDAGVLADRVELQNVKPRFPSPDFTGHYRLGRKWGYVQLGGVVRYIGYDDLLTTDKFDLSGHVWGWGVNLSSVLKVTPSDTLRLGVIQGAGVENYFNDAPIDVGIKANPGNAITPVVGEALGDFGLSLFLDHNWNSKYSTAIGYSRVDISNSNGQAANAYKDGQYALGNLLYAPNSTVMMGGELQWIHRENFADGFSVSDVRFQFSFKVNFGVKVGG